MKLQGQALQQVAGAYALGTLGSRARRRFQALMKHNVEARRAWQQWEQRLSAVAQDLPPVRPAANAWASIEARIGQKSQPRGRATRRLVWVAALLLGAVLAVLWVRLSGRQSMS